MGNVVRMETRAMALGRCAHQVVQRVLMLGLPDDGVRRVDRVLSVTRQVLLENAIRVRERAALLEVASAASSYFRHFGLPDGWAPVSYEHRLGNDGRVDVVHQERDCGLWLIDELKLGINRSHDAALRPQVDRYVAAGQDEWGDRFVGVRVCAVASPRESQLFAPGKKKGIRLRDTPLWPDS